MPSLAEKRLAALEQYVLDVRGGFSYLEPERLQEIYAEADKVKVGGKLDVGARKLRHLKRLIAAALYRHLNDRDNKDYHETLRTLKWACAVIETAREQLGDEAWSEIVRASYKREVSVRRIDVGKFRRKARARA